MHASDQQSHESNHPGLRRGGFTFGAFLQRLPRPSVRLLKLTDPDKVCSTWFGTPVHAHRRFARMRLHSEHALVPLKVQLHQQPARAIMTHGLGHMGRMCTTACGTCCAHVDHVHHHVVCAKMSTLHEYAGRGGGVAAPGIPVDARPGTGVLPDAARTLCSAAPGHHRQVCSCRVKDSFSVAYSLASVWHRAAAVGQSQHSLLRNGER
jgi:hypothetical protein